MAAYGLVDDIDELAEAISVSGGFPSGNALGVARDKAVAEFLRFAACYDIGNPQISHKRSHTLRVAMNADEIARRATEGSLYNGSQRQFPTLDEGWSPDGGACFLMGLLHDVGRFPQYAMYRTYSDEESFPHAEISYVMLTEFGMMGRFVDVTSGDYEQQRLLGRLGRAIREHSKLSLGVVAGRERAYCDVLRDADKIDILEECCHALSSEGFDETVAKVTEAMTGRGTLPDLDPIDAPTICGLARKSGTGFSVSDCVMEDVLAGRLVDRRNVVTAGDDIAMVASLFVGVETAPARGMLSDRGTMERIRECVEERYCGLDGTGTLRRAMDVVVGKA